MFDVHLFLPLAFQALGISSNWWLANDPDCKSIHKILDDLNGVVEGNVSLHFLLDRDTAGVYYRKALSQFDIIC